MKGLNFQDEIPSILIDNFEDLYVLIFDLFSIQDATHFCYYPEWVREPLRLELYFSSPLVIVTEFNVLGKRMTSVAVDRFGIVRKKLWKRQYFPWTKSQHYSSAFVLVHWFNSSRLCFHSSKSQFWHYRRSTQQHAMWVLDNAGHVSSGNVFRQISWSIHQNFFLKRMCTQLILTGLQGHFSVCGF